MSTISAIRSAVQSAPQCGLVSSADEMKAARLTRRTLESMGFRFRMIGDSLAVKNASRLNGLATPADLRVVKAHAKRIRLTFAG